MVGRKKMRDYFIVAYEKDKVLREAYFSTKALMMKLLKLKKDGFKIVKIIDEYHEEHDFDEMLEIYEESIEIEFEDVNTKMEAYYLAYTYFEDLYTSREIDKKSYQKYIQRLNTYQEKTSEVKVFIEQIKLLYLEVL